MLTGTRFAGALSIVLVVTVWADEKPTFSVDVNVVNILASVRNRDGAIINDLKEDDFILTEDGEKQEIRYFARRTDLPLTIGLLVDTSMSQQNVIEIERGASCEFFNQVLRPDRDQAFVISFDIDVELLQDLTSSRRELEDALNALELPARPMRKQGRKRFAAGNFQQWPGSGGGWPGGGGGWPGGGTGWPGGGRRGGGPPGGPGAPPPSDIGRAMGTALYDSVYLASDEVLRGQSGRKAIILISDGVDMGSIVSKYDAIESAQRADAIIYSIRYYDDAAYRAGGRRGGRKGPDREAAGLTALERLSLETGGRMFEVMDDRPLEAIFELIQEELRNQYSIGYTPSKEAGREFRKIELSTRDESLKVQVRTGYYSDESE